jgi:hypothetical protein
MFDRSYVRTVLKVAWVNLAILTTLLVCIEGFASGYYFVRRTLSAEDPVIAFVRTHVSKMPRDGYPNPADQSWFEAYWKEFNDSTYASVDWASYSNYRRRPFSGKYINIDRNGRRSTWSQDPGDAPGLIRLALFGGSTIWGTGARDEFTIPSYVSKILAEKYPHRFRVVNYGQDGYVSTQETITLLREIQMDRVPDIAVFYDGFNEIFTAMQAGAAGIPMNEYNRMLEFNILHPSRTRDFYFEVLSRTNTFQLIRGLRTKLWPEVVADSLRGRDTGSLARDVVKVYSSNVEFVSAMAKEFGVGVQFYWQPSVFTKDPPTEPEKAIIRSSTDFAVDFAALYRQAQEAMRQNNRIAGRSDFRDISNILDGYSKTAFIDTVHATELANQVIAREIVAGLTGTLERSLSRASADRAKREQGPGS